MAAETRGTPCETQSPSGGLQSFRLVLIVWGLLCVPPSVFWENKALLERPLKAGPAKPRAGALWGDQLHCPSELSSRFSPHLTAGVARTPAATRRKEA